MQLRLKKRLLGLEKKRASLNKEKKAVWVNVRIKDTSDSSELTVLEIRKNRGSQPIWETKAGNYFLDVSVKSDCYWRIKILQKQGKALTNEKGQVHIIDKKLDSKKSKGDSSKEADSKADIQRKHEPLKAESADKISSIKKLELYEQNTDSKPEKDSFKIFVIFGDKNGKSIKPSDGVVMNYACKIYRYENRKKGRKIITGKGKLISKRGFTFFFIKLPGINQKIRVLADVTVELPNGKSVRGKRSSTFDPEDY